MPENEEGQQSYTFLSQVEGYYGEIELELEGTGHALKELGNFLKNNKEDFVRIKLQNTLPEPPGSWHGFLVFIEISVVKEQKLFEIRRENHTLKIYGSSNVQDILASNITSLSEATDPKSGIAYHIHIDYYPEHFYLAPTSEPLVITKCREDDIRDSSQPTPEADLYKEYTKQVQLQVVGFYSKDSKEVGIAGTAIDLEQLATIVMVLKVNTM